MPVGEIGGPDSEIFFDFGEDYLFHGLIERTGLSVVHHRASAFLAALFENAQARYISEDVIAVSGGPQFIGSILLL